MFFIKVYGQFPETSEKLAFLASQKKHVPKWTHINASFRLAEISLLGEISRLAELI